MDYHLILDLVPDAARCYFGGRLPGVALPRVQAAILLSMGLQRCSLDATASALSLASNQVLALFAKALRKIGGALTGVIEAAAGKELDAALAKGTQALASAVGGARVGKKAAAAAAVGSGSKGAAAGGSAAGAAAGAAATAGAAPTATPLLSKAAVASLLADDELSRYVVPSDAAFDKELGADGAGGARKAKRKGTLAEALAGDGGGAVPAVVSIERAAAPAQSAAAVGAHVGGSRGGGGGGGKKARRE